MTTCTEKGVLTRLAGTWLLFSYQNFFPNGTLNPVADVWMGDSPAGMITYTSAGFMSANIAATQSSFRPQALTLPPQQNQSDSDWALVGYHSIAYAGPVSAVEETNTTGWVMHGPVIVASTPSVENTVLRRGYELADDDALLYLRSPFPDGSVTKLGWRRAR